MAGLPEDRLFRPKLSKKLKIAHISQNEHQ